MKRPLPLIDTFWSKVRKGDECWEWHGARKKPGYGVVDICARRGSRQRQYAHRFSWELHNGPIPEGLYVCHHCDNPPCVNPRHLFLGSHKDNQRDKADKGRHWQRQHPERVRRGAATPWAKATDVVALRALYRSGWTQVRLAAHFGISQSQVSRIVRGETWHG